MVSTVNARAEAGAASFESRIVAIVLSRRGAHDTVPVDHNVAVEAEGK